MKPSTVDRKIDCLDAALTARGYVETPHVTKDLAYKNLVFGWVFINIQTGSLLIDKTSSTGNRRGWARRSLEDEQQLIAWGSQILKE